MAFKELDRWLFLMIHKVILNITGIVSTQEQLNTPLLMKLVVVNNLFEAVWRFKDRLVHGRGDELS